MHIKIKTTPSSYMPNTIQQENNDELLVEIGHLRLEKTLFFKSLLSPK